MTLGARLRAWWWDYRQRVKGRPGHCVICREGLAALGGGYDLGGGNGSVCSQACADDYESRVAW